MLAKLLGVPRVTVSACWRLFKDRKTFEDAPRSGRPRKTTQRTDRAIKRASVRDPMKTGVQIRAEVEERLGVVVGTNTVKRRLREMGLFGRRPVKKPFVSRKNRMARLAFARKHLDWTADQWSKVLFSDESKFCLFGNPRAQFVRRPIGHRLDPKYQRPTIKHGGGSIMVWGAFSAHGVGPLSHIDGTMTGEVYRNILRDTMRPYARRTMPRGFLFQHDNDPKHTSRVAKTWLLQNKIRTLEWPAQSPDLNPIEHLWDELGRKCAGIRVRNAEEKFELLETMWKDIPRDKISGLIDSMPRRMQAVIGSKGFPIGY